MPIMTDVRSVAANSTVANVLSGKSNEFLSEDSQVQIGVAGSVVGLFYSVIIGNRNVVEDQEASSINRMPQIPQDVVVDEVGLAGERLVVKLRNSTAGAITGFTMVRTTPLG